MWYIYTMEYCSVIKKNGILSFVTMWMEPDIILGQASQAQKDKYCMISLTNGILKS
jgi:hypothetical protein